MKHHFFINKLKLIFRYLAAEEDTLLGGEQMLFEILHFDFFQIPHFEIAKISVEVDDLKRKGDGSSMRALLKERAHRPPVDLFDTGLNPALIKFSDAIEGLTHDVPLRVLFDRMLTDMGLAEYATKNNFNPELSTFSALINKAIIKNPFMRTGDFISFLDEEMVAWLPLPRSSDRRVLEPLDRFFVAKRLEKFVMNVSALNNYLQCPMHFYYQNLLRMPSGKSEALGFGSAMHYAVEKLFEKMKSNPGEVFPSKREMVEYFNRYMTESREVFTKESFERKMAHGAMVIGNYYD